MHHDDGHIESMYQSRKECEMHYLSVYSYLCVRCVMSVCVYSYVCEMHYFSVYSYLCVRCIISECIHVNETAPREYTCRLL